MKDSRRDIERDAGELVADYASGGPICDELYDGILGLLDRQAALTEREVEHDLMKAGRMAVEVERERIAELQAELDELRPPRIVEFTELESDEPPYDELLRCLENDWHISASWDGLRKFWNVELTEEGVRLRDAELRAELDAHVKPRTVEDVLRELADVARLDRAHDLDDGDIEGFAAEIRELLLGDEPFCEQVDRWLHGDAPSECRECGDGRYGELTANDGEAAR